MIHVMFVHWNILTQEDTEKVVEQFKQSHNEFVGSLSLEDIEELAKQYDTTLFFTFLHLPVGTQLNQNHQEHKVSFKFLTLLLSQQFIVPMN